MPSIAGESRQEYATVCAEDLGPGKPSMASRARAMWRNISVEPIIVCYVLPNVLGSVGMQHLYLEKACRVDLEYPAATCDAIATHVGDARAAEAAVQRHVATAFAYKNVLQSVIPATLLLFIGSCADRHNRRKPWMLAPLGCELATIVGFWLTTYFFFEVGVVANVLIDGVAPVVTGGGYAFASAVYAHISRISSEEARTVRIGAANMLTNVCTTLGSALSGVVYVHMGFYGVYVVSLVFYLVGLAYGLLLLQEAPPTRNFVAKACTCGDFFDPSHIKATCAVAFSSGSRQRRVRLWAMMLLVVVIMGPMHGEFVVTYLFVRYQFQWTEIEYSVFSTYYSVVHIGGTLFSLMVFSKYFQLDDAVVGMISSCSKILSSVVYAFAPNAYVFYMAVVIEMFNGTSFIAMRSITSKLVEADEIGKIYSLFALCEALMPLLYGPLYTSIYKASLDFMPGMYFIAGGLLTIPSVIVFCWLYFEDKKDSLGDREDKTSASVEEGVAMVDENTSNHNGCETSTV